jgi:hypothetical protein
MGNLVVTVAYPKTESGKISRETIMRLVKKHNLKEDPHNGEYYGEKFEHYAFGIAGARLLNKTLSEQRVDGYVQDVTKALNRARVEGYKVRKSFLPM